MNIFAKLQVKRKPAAAAKAKAKAKVKATSKAGPHKKPASKVSSDKSYEELSPEERILARPEGCSKCRRKPGCSPSCWKKG